jgi:hypothetical protein
MERLTGLTLLAHHQSFHYTKADKVREAGYVGIKNDGSERILFTAYYEEVLKIQNWQKRLDLTNDQGGSKCIQNVLFYAENRTNLKKDDDEVTYNERFNWVNIWHHGKWIAIITPGYVTIYADNRSKSTKERLNRILMRFCGCQVYQKNKVWYVHNPMSGDVEFVNNMKVEKMPAYSALFPV